MKQRVYLETSFIGYLTSWPSRDLIMAASQQLTHDWWNKHRHLYELYISSFVLDECNEGDPVAAKERLVIASKIPELALSEEVFELGQAFITEGRLPEKASVDAYHVAIAAINNVDYLLTWNCKHIANAVFRRTMEAIIRDQGYEPPTICTPQELMDEDL